MRILTMMVTDILLGNFAFSAAAWPEDLKARWQTANYGLIIFENLLNNKNQISLNDYAQLDG
ncbi:MAG: hypothetical protein ABIR81_11745 [Ginsengibacter sp.]